MIDFMYSGNDLQWNWFNLIDIFFIWNKIVRKIENIFEILEVKWGNAYSSLRCLMIREWEKSIYFGIRNCASTNRIDWIQVHAFQFNT
jgi:hypothetical protein